MKPSPTMQRLITQLAAKHGVDLAEPGQYLRLALPDHPIHLIIETTEDRQVIVGCYDAYGTEDADPSMHFAPGYPTGWLPVELLYSPQEWATFRQQAECALPPDAVDLADLTEYWAKRLIEQGWLRSGEKRAEPHGRLPGCQSTNHAQCYGELWQCAACKKWVCCAEGTDNDPALCDDCWAQRYDPTLVIACDCSEEQCGAWLELTPDGILAIEDKDGLRVSLLLPDWLDGAMRTVLLESRLTQTNQAVSDREGDEAQPPAAATLWQWVDEHGKCTATNGCWCDPEGTCEHGHPSWLVVLGLI
jgi:hypothetical protein